MNDMTDTIWERFAVSGDQTALGFIFKNDAVAERIEVAELDNCIYQFPAFMPHKLYAAMAKEAEIRAEALGVRFESRLLPQRSTNRKKIYSLRT